MEVNKAQIRSPQTSVRGPLDVWGTFGSNDVQSKPKAPKSCRDHKQHPGKIPVVLEGTHVNETSPTVSLSGYYEQPYFIVFMGFEREGSRKILLNNNLTEGATDTQP